MSLNPLKLFKLTPNRHRYPLGTKAHSRDINVDQRSAVGPRNFIENYYKTGKFTDEWVFPSKNIISYQFYESAMLIRHAGFVLNSQKTKLLRIIPDHLHA